MRIKDTPRIDRPQEKLFKYGPQKLKDAELLAIILRTGVEGINVVELSQKIIRKFGKKFNDLTLGDLKGIKGLGKTKSAQLVASLELAKRYLKKESRQFLSPREIFNSLFDLRRSRKEQLVAIYLDTRNVEVKREIISTGTLNANLVHPREVFEPAVQNLAAGIILVHNHPSGDPEPSEEDKKITKQLIEAGKILGIEVLDHIIIGQENFTSLKDKGLI